MPTYGYQCKQCQYEFSVFQKMSDEPVRICPECAGEVKRLLYPVGIVFKGSGWYITDSRKPEKTGEGEGGKAESKADGDAAPKPEESAKKPEKTETTAKS